MGVRYPLDLITLSAEAGSPLHRQLCTQLRDLILDGAVPSGTRLPSIRAFAGDLGISRNTVVAALDQLSAEGLIESRHGSGTRVTADASAGPSGALDSSKDHPGLATRGRLMTTQPRVRTFPGRTAFHPGTPELAEFPFKTWSRLLARRARFGSEDLFGYHDIAGHPELREAIASFLGAMRHVRCTPDQIVVTTGGQAALDLLARLLLDPGDTVWMEEPGYLGARGAFLSAGARLEPLPVSRDGWHVPRAPAPHLIYLTPSCQHPLGITMPVEQRVAIHDAARSFDAWIIEDDFDGEYTFRGRPTPAIQGLSDGSRVIYVGTFSKMLFPAMRLGFMVLPPDLASHIKPALSITGQFAPLVLQAALADFIRDGHFFRHLNRKRRLYEHRRALFLELFAEHLSDWLEPIDGRTGIQIAAVCKGDVDDCAIVRRAADNGVNLAPLSLYFNGAPALRGLLMGYAGVDETAMRQAFPKLREIIDTVAS